MHAKIIIRVFALVAIILSAFMLPPFIMALSTGADSVIRGFELTYIALITVAVLGLTITHKVRFKQLSVRDSFLLVFSVWLGLSLFAALPYYLSGTIKTASDAFFEAASGITCTGASIISNLAVVHPSMLLWRALSHWLGGMGIIMLTVALLPFFGIGGLQLMKAEQHGVEGLKMTSRIAETARYLWFIYLSFTIVVVMLLRATGMPMFEAILYSFSVVASGGLAPHSQGVGFYESHYIHWIMIIAMLCAGASFPLYFNLFSGKLDKVFKNSELKAYLLITIVASMVVATATYISGSYDSIADSVRNGFFHVSSILSTTGFSIADYSVWAPIAQFVLFMLYFIGGCSGSTAGGVKVVRLVVIFKQAMIEIRRLLHPHGVFPLRLNGASVPKEAVYSVSGFFILYLFTVLFVAAGASLAGVSIRTALVSALAMVGNVGMGIGPEIGPGCDYSFYPWYVKCLFGLAMIVGRLELYTFYALLTPFFWRNK
ncbi:potassium transporter TrkG [Deferribacterales bacterium RsTz2092]|nr:Trk system potassium transporter TrkH [Deferribacterales bacterium]